MKNNDIFGDSMDLPPALTKEQTNSLINELAKGSSIARDELIVHNIRLVLFVIEKYFYSVNYDKKDLASIGIIGLIKAVDTYNSKVKTLFSSYASKCIYNEICMFVRKLSKDYLVDSLDEMLDQEKHKVWINDKFISENNIIEDYDYKETIMILQNIIDTLPHQDKELLALYYGFNGNNPHSAAKIASLYNVSKATISRRLNQIIAQIVKDLVRQGIDKEETSLNVRNRKK